MFEKVLKPIANTLGSWKHTGFVAFPEIDNRNELNHYLKLAKKDLMVKRTDVFLMQIKIHFFQFVLTKDEIEDKDCKWLDEFTLKIGQNQADQKDSYRNLISLIVGSHFVSFENPIYSPSKDILQTNEIITKNAKLTASQKMPDLRVKLVDIKGKSLGKLESILFWNDEQMELYKSLKKFKHTILAGDYGSGKTVIAASIADYYNDHHEIEDVHFISALDIRDAQKVHNREMMKQTEDVFDVMMEERFSGTVKYVGIAKLRRMAMCVSYSNLIKKLQKYDDDTITFYEDPKSIWTDRLIFNHLQTIKNRDKTAIIIDELNIVGNDKDDLSNIDDSSYLGKLLQFLTREFKMVLIIINSASLLDRTVQSVSQANLKSFLHGMNGYKYFELPKVMRNSRSIVSASSITNINKCLKTVEMKEIIPSGRASTIAGHRPTCILYNMENDWKTRAQSSKCIAWARCIKKYLDKVKIDLGRTKLKVAVLCETYSDTSRGTCPRVLSEEIGKFVDKSKIHLFEGSLIPVTAEELRIQKRSLKDWLSSSSGGLLLTTTLQFRGCEADVAIIIGTDLSFRIRGHRGCLTRAVAHLCYVVGNTLVNVEEISKNFEVLYDDDVK